LILSPVAFYGQNHTVNNSKNLTPLQRQREERERPPRRHRYTGRNSRMATRVLRGHELPVTAVAIFPDVASRGSQRAVVARTTTSSGRRGAGDVWVWWLCCKGKHRNGHRHSRRPTMHTDSWPGSICGKMHDPHHGRTWGDMTTESTWCYTAHFEKLRMRAEHSAKQRDV